jgi:hypothetical protein
MNPRRSILSAALACLLLVLSGAISCESAGRRSAGASKEVASEEYHVMSAVMRIREGESMSLIKSLPLYTDSTASMASIRRQRDSLFQVYSNGACCYAVNRQTVRTGCVLDTGVFGIVAAGNCTPDLIRDFHKNNDTTYELKLDQFEDSLVVGLYSPSEFDGTLDASAWWAAFLKKYPRSHGVFDFSRVGFNSDSTVALVYVEIGQRPVFESGDECLLKKNNGVWQMLSRVDCGVR